MTNKVVEFDKLEELPDSWEWVPLGELMVEPKVDIVDGPFGSNLKASEYTNTGIHIARLQNIDRNLFVYKNIRYISSEKAEQLDRHNFKPGDILITKLGAPLGKACIAPKKIIHGIIVADLVRVRIRNDNITREYLTYAINSPFLVKQFERHTKGTTRPRVNLGVIRKLPIPVAPQNEQKRIVAEIEKQFSRLDEAVENLKRVKANLKRYKASVLKAAVEGKLTEKWRDKNKADVIPENIFDVVSRERIVNYNKLCDQAKKAGKPKPKKPTNVDSKFSVNEDVLKTMSSIPKEWQYVHIAFITNDEPDSIVDGPFGSSINVKKDYIEYGIPVIRINNIAPFKFINDNLKYLRKKKFVKLKRHNIMPGDILFGKVGTIGNSCIYPNSMQEGMLSTTGSCRIRVDEGLYHKNFLCLVLNAYKPIFNRIASAAVQAFLNMQTIKNFPIPLLSLNEQETIMKYVDALLSIAERIETQVDRGLIRAERLRQSVLKKAFTGKLVPQDPIDEPANVILKKIKAEKEVRKSESKKEKKGVKVIKMAKQKIIIKLTDVLVKFEKPISPETLFKEAGYTIEKIDEFYESLKYEVDNTKRIEEIRPDNAKVLLRLVS